MSKRSILDDLNYNGIGDRGSLPANDPNLPADIKYGARNTRSSRFRNIGERISSVVTNKYNIVPSAIGKIALIVLSVGFFYVLFQEHFDFEVIFKRVIGTNMSAFNLSDFITYAHSILPDGIGIFDGIENLLIAIGCIGYVIAFLISLIFNIFFA